MKPASNLTGNFVERRLLRFAGTNPETRSEEIVPPTEKKDTPVDPTVRHEETTRRADLFARNETGRLNTVAGEPPQAARVEVQRQSDDIRQRAAQARKQAAGEQVPTPTPTTEAPQPNAAETKNATRKNLEQRIQSAETKISTAKEGTEKLSAYIEYAVLQLSLLMQSLGDVTKGTAMEKMFARPGKAEATPAATTGPEAKQSRRERLQRELKDAGEGPAGSRRIEELKTKKQAELRQDEAAPQTLNAEKQLQEFEQARTTLQTRKDGLLTNVDEGSSGANAQLRADITKQIEELDRRIAEQRVVVDREKQQRDARRNRNDTLLRDIEELEDMQRNIARTTRALLDHLPKDAKTEGQLTTYKLGNGDSIRIEIRGEDEVALELETGGTRVRATLDLTGENAIVFEGITPAAVAGTRLATLLKPAGSGQFTLTREDFERYLSQTEANAPAPAEANEQR